MCEKKTEKKEIKKVKDLDIKDLEQVTGGSGAFANVPRVKTHNYDSVVKNKNAGK